MGKQKWICSNCGKIVVQDIEFCPYCNHERKRENVAIVDDQKRSKFALNLRRSKQESAWICSNCGDNVFENMDFCPHCKHKRVKKVDDKKDSKFVGIHERLNNGRNAAEKSSISISNFVKTLFSNPGRTIKRFAIVEFLCAAIGGFICGIVLPYDQRGDFEFWLAVKYIVGGFAIGYVSAIPIYAFGSFVEDTAENKATLLRIEEQLKITNQYTASKNDQ